MSAEPYLDQLIDALQQMRAWVNQVGTARRNANELWAIHLELDQKLIAALAIFSQLSASRIPATVDDLPIARKRAEQSLALSKALHAISPDYSVETIDAAISLAASQS
jgi:hypothetical protein